MEHSYVCKQCGKEMFSLTETGEYWGEIYCKRCYGYLTNQPSQTNVSEGIERLYEQPSARESESWPKPIGSGGTHAQRPTSWLRQIIWRLTKNVKCSHCGKVIELIDFDKVQANPKFQEEIYKSLTRDERLLEDLTHSRRFKDENERLKKFKEELLTNPIQYGMTGIVCKSCKTVVCVFCALTAAANAGAATDLKCPQCNESIKYSRRVGKNMVLEGRVFK